MSKGKSDNEIVIQASIDESGLQAKAKSRALSAFDRLLGSLLDVPAAYLEECIETLRNRAESRRRLMNSELDAALKVLAASDEFGHTLAEETLANSAAKMLNKKIVALEALKDIKDSNEDIQDGELEDEWLNYFDSYAEKATSTEMRSIWGKILSGEIQRPKSFSRRTLRIVSEIDRESAELFQNECLKRSSDGYILYPKKMEGAKLIALHHLEEVGLLQDLSGVSRNFDMEGGITLIWEDNYVLRMRLDQVSVKAIRLTQAGKELSTIIPKAPGKVFLKELYDQYGAEAEAADICVVTEELENSQVRVNTLIPLRGVIW